MVRNEVCPANGSWRTTGSSLYNSAIIPWRANFSEFQRSGSSVMYRIFSDLLHRSLAFLWHSRLFLTISVCPMTISIRSVSLHCLSDCSVIRPFHVFRLFPSISSFRLVSFQFSILGSDRSESGSLLSIRLHFCSATIPFPFDLHVLLSFDLMTSVSPSNYDPFSYCSVLYINPASYVVIC